MHMVSLFEAKTHLSRIVDAIVSGKEDHVVISRRGKPVVRLTAVRATDGSKRIGLARVVLRYPTILMAPTTSSGRCSMEWTNREASSRHPDRAVGVDGQPTVVRQGEGVDPTNGKRHLLQRGVGLGDCD